jgi:hypothetical protein
MSSGHPANFAAVLARIRGFSGPYPAIDGSTDAPAHLLQSPASSRAQDAEALPSQDDSGLDPNDPLNRILIQCDVVGPEEQVAWVEQYIDAEARAVRFVLGSASGSALLGTVDRTEGDDPDARRREIDALCAQLQGNAHVPNPTTFARMLDRLNVTCVAR